ncbi:MAG: hypothetical protein IJ197_03160 [Bacteroidaceae bacterium]|nr:hypothetical protein [Bacteroidaceae bacterium]
MRKYKPQYTEAFRDEHIRWFEERMDKLPQSLKINDYTYTADLRTTVENLILHLRTNGTTIIFSGYMETLLRIEDRLKEEGLA